MCPFHSFPMTRAKQKAGGATKLKNGARRGAETQRDFDTQIEPRGNITDAHPRADKSSDVELPSR